MLVYMYNMDQYIQIIADNQITVRKGVKQVNKGKVERIKQTGEKVWGKGLITRQAQNIK